MKWNINVSWNLNVISNPNDETNFPHKLLLTNRQVWRICKAFANGSWANIYFSKSQLHEIGKSGEFLGRLLEALLKTVLLLMKNVLKPLAKSILIPSGTELNNFEPRKGWCHEKSLFSQIIWFNNRKCY